MEKYHKFKGVQNMSRMLNSYKNNVLVYFDPDVDGMISGYLVCKYLKSIGKSFSWYVNSNRSHDWSIPYGKLKGVDIIAVDFKIPQSVISDIVKSGSNIISLDHHVNQDTFIEITHKSKKGIVINNQYPFEEEDGAYLSGAGVVFETLVSLNPSFDSSENRALVGLTLLSDVCNIENPFAKEYLKELYNHKMKGYIKYLIQNTIGEKDYGFGVPRLDRKYVDYKFSPAINSCLRFNREDDVVRFFLGSGRLDLSYHKRQQELVKRLVEASKVVELRNLRVVYFREEDVMSLEETDVFANFVGLLASRFLDGKKSVLAYSIAGDTGSRYVKRASFRGNINGTDYLSHIKEYVRAEGHPSAFGVLDLVVSSEVFKNIDKACSIAENGNTNTQNITPVSNLSFFANKKGKDYAEYNMYCLSQNSKYIRYIGNKISIKAQGANFIKYKVDGVDVMAFDLNLNFSNGLIYPILERGFVYYYLQKI